jgi:hypothetical protein
VFGEPFEAQWLLCVCVTGISIREICILSTESIPVAFVGPRREGDFFYMQPLQIGYFHTQDKLFIIW